MIPSFAVCSRHAISRVLPSRASFVGACRHSLSFCSQSPTRRHHTAFAASAQSSSQKQQQEQQPSAASAMGTNADLSRMATASTAEMEWVQSPVPNVWRKRVFHTGGTESGRVTSIVKYGEGSSFHMHPHPEGEEIFVLEGTFTDVRGDHRPGTLLLNPEGFEHAPSSVDGCVILVRLRQYPGDRPQMALDSTALEWKAVENSGSGSVETKKLFSDSRFEDTIQLQRWGSGTEVHLSEPKGLELFVLSGSCESVSDPDVKLSAHCWMRVPPGSSHTLRCSEPCEVYLKANALSLAEPLAAAA